MSCKYTLKNIVCDVALSSIPFGMNVAQYYLRSVAILKCIYYLFIYSAYTPPFCPYWGPQGGLWLMFQ